MPHKPCTANVVALAPVRHTEGDTTCTNVSQKVNHMRHILTHCVSQPAFLHLTTPLNEPLWTDPNRHPFNASASCRWTLLRFEHPESFPRNFTDFGSQCMIYHFQTRWVHTTFLFTVIFSRFIICSVQLISTFYCYAKANHVDSRCQ